MGFKKPKFNLINWIKTKWKQLWCKHEWRIKDTKLIKNHYFSERKCHKCKKLKYIHIKI